MFKNGTTGMHLQSDTQPLLGAREKEESATRQLKIIVYILSGMLCINFVIMVGLIYLGVQFFKPHGLQDTFYELSDDFHYVHSSMESLNASITFLNGILTSAVNNVLPNVFEMCHQMTQIDPQKCKSWP
eukprot:m.107349 g.107349  ORF g.107349 m.107349 type:complete len:129 (-) comp15840_c0_seq1:375-761(-)